MATYPDPQWVTELEARAVLSTDATANIAIKRDVHNILVGAPAGVFINTLHDVLRTPGEMFGLISVHRPPERMGEPFVVGDRLQGRYSLEDAWQIDQDDDDSDDGFMERTFERCLRWIEDKHLSDYGLVTEVALDPTQSADGIARFRYVYLEGTPIAGSTTFECVPVGDDKCCFRSIFEYQELAYSTVLLFGSVGLRLHNQVIVAEAQLAAQRLGVEIEWMDVPEAYRPAPVAALPSPD